MKNKVIVAYIPVLVEYNDDAELKRFLQILAKDRWSRSSGMSGYYKRECPVKAIKLVHIKKEKRAKK